MPATTDHGFASGGIVSRLLDISRIREKSMRFKFLMLLALVALCWLPLAVLCFRQYGSADFFNLFVRDIATHVRFLLALPLLLIARLAVNKSFKSMVDTLHETKIIDSDNSAAFEKIMKWSARWRNAWVVDVVLLALVYYAFYVKETSTLNNSNFYAPWLIKDDSLSAAGWWYVVFSLPVLQMILYRWFYTIVLWVIFLRKLSRIKLKLSALHADGVGGLGFLRYTQLSFFFVALGFSCLAASGLNNMLIFSKVSLHDFQVLIISVLVFTILIFVLPLLVFVPLLSRVRKQYYLFYSERAWLCAREYEKELKAFSENPEARPDSSWHIDLIGSFEKTSDMKPVLIDKSILIAFTLAVLLPFIPVVAQVIPLKDLVVSLMKKFLG